MQNPDTMSQNSESWLFFVKAAFVISLIAMGCGIAMMPANLWVKGYLSMGTLLVVASSITLTKTLRDDFESRKIVNRISEAKARAILKEVDAV